MDIGVTPPPVPQAVQEQPQVIYAGFWRRFFAYLIDSLILSFVGFIIGFIFGFLGAASGKTNTVLAPVQLVESIILFVLGMVYYVYFIGSRGQTPGKMAMKIKVVKLGTNNPPGYGSAFLRETVGKFISSMVFSLGYFWMIWNHKKQTWHDKMAGTIVIKT